MKSEINVARALGAVFVRRVLHIYTIIGAVVAAGSLLLIWALAYFVSDWWWLLLIVYVPLVALFVAVRLLFVLAARRIYKQRVTPMQKKSLDEFIDTVQKLVETRAMGWPLFILVSVKDVLIHRDLRSLKKLISDTVGLRSEFNKLKSTLATKA